ncbi:hypothetical protein [Streptomyces sp. NE06-03C]|uniref:hypothetical protein n=1 Tax=Streptomyces sp. NE06-03C TaxID=3028694 RepID=UPI0029B50741|nr:hypothetical protein [Streptomyces sp. NE06-03C]MDX2922275.1 hypothetical protein [Streptomyces sp. NE06-03C]
MAVIGVLTKPVPPSWWAINKHRVWGLLGLALGFMLCTELHTPEHQEQRPRPSHSTPAATPTPR